MRAALQPGTGGNGEKCVASAPARYTGNENHRADAIAG